MDSSILRGAVFSLAAFCSTVPAVAQNASMLQAGQRVRVDRGGGERLVGVVTDPVAGAALTITTTAGQAVAVPLSDIRTLAVARPRTTIEGLRAGGTIGFIVGGVTGAIVAAIEAQTDENAYFGGGEAMLAGFAVVGAAGAVVGGIIGAAAPGTRWEPVRVPGTLGLTHTRSGGLALMMTIRR